MYLHLRVSECIHTPDVRQERRSLFQIFTCYIVHYCILYGVYIRYSLQPYLLIESLVNICCVFLSIQSIVFTTDIAVDSLSYTYSTSEVFQNVAVVFTFSIVLNFTGPKVPAGTSPHLVFAVYLSDGENITSSLNNGTTLRVDTESVTDGSVKQVEELKGEINDGDVSSRNTVNLALSKPWANLLVWILFSVDDCYNELMEAVLDKKIYEWGKSRFCKEIIGKLLK